MVKWFPVRVHFPWQDLGALGELDEDVMDDAIQGNTPLNALQNAAWNWPDAVWVELI